jgi:hypothetical protein
MAIGRPFQPGQKKPANSGRTKGVANKEPRLPMERLSNRIRRHIDKVMQRHERGIDKIEDPVEALKRDAQLTRDLVEMLRFSQPSESERAGHMADAQVAAEARRHGPITDEEAMAAYYAMCQGDSDAARIVAARFALSSREQLPEVLRDCRALREALAAGRFECRAQVHPAELFRMLTPPPVPESPRNEPQPSDLEHLRHRGIPVAGAPGTSLIEARELLEPHEHPEPPAPPRLVPLEAEPVRTYAHEDRDDSDSAWDDPRVTVVMGPLRRF